MIFGLMVKTMKYYQINLYRLENNFPQKALLHRVFIVK